MKNHVVLSEADKNYLFDLLHQSSLTRKHLQRATALIALDEGDTYLKAAAKSGATHQTVSVWAEKYSKEGLAFLDDKPRSGRPPEIDGDARAKITALACSKPPEGRLRWTLRLLSDKIVELGYAEQISHSQVRDVLKKTNCSPTGNATGV